MRPGHGPRRVHQHPGDAARRLEPAGARRGQERVGAGGGADDVPLRARTQPGGARRQRRRPRRRRRRVRGVRRPVDAHRPLRVAQLGPLRVALRRPPRAPPLGREQPAGAGEARARRGRRAARQGGAAGAQRQLQDVGHAAVDGRQRGPPADGAVRRGRRRRAAGRRGAGRGDLLGDVEEGD